MIRLCRFTVWLLLTIWLLAACTEQIDTPGEPLVLRIQQLPSAYLGEFYTHELIASGGLRPYSWRLSGGTLPPGLELVSGLLRGTPTETGTFAFTVTVSDANLSKTFRDLTLVVTQPPEPSLTFNVPLTEVEGSVTLRAQLQDGRDWRALRTRVSWDTERFALVENSVRANRNDLALLFTPTETGLQIDTAVLGKEGLSGEPKLFEFKLQALAASHLQITAKTEFLRGGDQKHSFEQGREGTAPRPQVEGERP